MRNIQSQLSHQGFIVLRNLFTQTQLQEISDEIEHLVDSVLSHHKLPQSNCLEKKLITLFEFNQEVYLNTVRAFSRLISIQQSFVSSRILKYAKKLGISQPLIPTGPVVHIMSDRLKIENGYFGQPAHQDWPSMQGSLNALVFWVALTKVTTSNYPVEVVPGSHLKGFIKGKVQANFYEIPDGSFNEADFIDVLCEPGDAMVFSSFLVHRTAIKEKTGFRLAASFRFDDADEKQYISRGFTTAYKRVVERQLCHEDIPGIDAIQLIYSESSKRFHSDN